MVRNRYRCKLPRCVLPTGDGSRTCILDAEGLMSVIVINRRQRKRPYSQQSVQPMPLKLSRCRVRTLEWSNPLERLRWRTRYERSKRQ
jgi:hypothetical protein